MNLPPTNECVRCAQARPVLWCTGIAMVGEVDLEPSVVRLVDLATGKVLIVDCKMERSIATFSQQLVPGHSYSLDCLLEGVQVSFRPYVDDGSGLPVLSDEFIKCVTFTAYKPFGRVDSIDYITLST